MIFWGKCGESDIDKNHIKTSVHTYYINCFMLSIQSYSLSENTSMWYNFQPPLELLRDFRVSANTYQLQRSFTGTVCFVSVLGSLRETNLHRHTHTLSLSLSLSLLYSLHLEIQVSLFCHCVYWKLLLPADGCNSEIWALVGITVPTLDDIFSFSRPTGLFNIVCVCVCVCDAANFGKI